MIKYNFSKSLAYQFRTLFLFFNFFSQYFYVFYLLFCLLSTFRKDTTPFKILYLFRHLFIFLHIA